MLPRPLLLMSVPVLVACAGGPPAAPVKADRTVLIEQRKDAVVAQLADCESGAGGAGGQGRYVGRFQFEPRTVVAFVRERDGHTISTREAVAIASDYGQASALVKYIVFERNGASHWPACGRKIGLSRQVEEIRAL